MTLVPYPEMAEHVRQVPFTCLFCGNRGGEDVILNILLFVPLGIGLRLAGLPRWKALGIAVLTTLTVESLQYAVIVGRHASVGDLLANSMGGWLGISLAHHWRGLILPRPPPARRLAWIGMAFWLGILTASAALLSIALPQTNYLGLWPPQVTQYGQFHGSVVDATLNGTQLPGTRLDSGKVRAELERESFALEVSATGDVPDPGLASIVSVFDEQNQEILHLGRSGRDLFFRVRMRTGALGLHTPALRLKEVLPTISGKMLRIRAGLDRGRLFLQLTGEGLRYRRKLALSPSWGWSFVLPFEYAFGPEAYVLTALWIGGLLFPIAYWTRRGFDAGGERWRAVALLALVVGMGLGVVPLATGLPVVHWSEWLGAGAGTVGGWWLGDPMAAVARATLR